jgi:hypothetical protein
VSVAVEDEAVGKGSRSVRVAVVGPGTDLEWPSVVPFTFLELLGGGLGRDAISREESFVVDLTVVIYQPSAWNTTERGQNSPCRPVSQSQARAPCSSIQPTRAPAPPSAPPASPPPAKAFPVYLHDLKQPRTQCRSVRRGIWPVPPRGQPVVPQVMKSVYVPLELSSCRIDARIREVCWTVWVVLRKSQWLVEIRKKGMDAPSRPSVQLSRAGLIAFRPLEDSTTGH